MTAHTFTLPSIPAELHWYHDPLDWQIDGTDLTITTGENTDWFIDPNGTFTKGDAPCALFTPPDASFSLCAKVTVEFGSKYDAGVLRIHDRDDLWAKACFEYSPQGKPMVVSVVTRGTSDDCNSTIIDGNSVYLRISHNAENNAGQNASTFAIHYSLDGQFWHLARYFTLGKLEHLQVGFSSQSPTGKQCKSVFSDIVYRAGIIKDIRSGE